MKNFLRTLSVKDPGWIMAMPGFIMGVLVAIGYIFFISQYAVMP